MATPSSSIAQAVAQLGSEQAVLVQDVAANTQSISTLRADATALEGAVEEALAAAQATSGSDERVLAAIDSAVADTPDGVPASSAIIGAGGSSIDADSRRVVLVGADSVNVKGISNAVVLNARGDVPVDDNSTILVSQPLGTQGSTTRGAAGVVVSSWESLPEDKRAARAKEAFDDAGVSPVPEALQCADRSNMGVNVSASTYLLGSRTVSLPEVVNALGPKTNQTGSAATPFKGQLKGGKVTDVSAYTPALLASGTFTSSNGKFTGATGSTSVTERTVSGNKRRNAGVPVSQYNGSTNAYSYSGVSGADRVYFEVDSVRLAPRTADNEAVDADDAEDDLLGVTVGTLEKFTARKLMHAPGKTGAVADLLSSSLVSGKQLDNLRSFLFTAMSAYTGSAPSMEDIDAFFDATVGVGPPLYKLACRALTPARVVDAMKVDDIAVDTAGAPVAGEVARFIGSLGASVGVGGAISVPSNGDNAVLDAVWDALVNTAPGAPLVQNGDALTLLDGTPLPSDKYEDAINGRVLVRETFATARLMETTAFSATNAGDATYAQNVLRGSAPTQDFPGFTAPAPAVCTAMNTAIATLQGTPEAGEFMKRLRDALALDRSTARAIIEQEGTPSAPTAAQRTAAKAAATAAFDAFQTNVDNAFLALQGVNPTGADAMVALVTFFGALSDTATGDALFDLGGDLGSITIGSTTLTLATAAPELDALRTVITNNLQAAVDIQNYSAPATLGQLNSNTPGANKILKNYASFTENLNVTLLVQELLQLYKDGFVLTEEYVAGSNCARLTDLGKSFFEGIEYDLELSEGTDTFTVATILYKDGKLQACLSNKYELTAASLWDFASASSSAQDITEGLALSSFINLLLSSTTAAVMAGGIAASAAAATATSGAPIGAGTIVDKVKSGRPSILFQMAYTAGAGNVLVAAPDAIVTPAAVDGPTVMVHPGMDRFLDSFGLPFVTYPTNANPRGDFVQNEATKQFIVFDAASGNVVLDENVLALHSQLFQLNKAATEKQNIPLVGGAQDIVPAHHAEVDGAGRVVYTSHAQLAMRDRNTQWAKPAKIMVNDGVNAPHEDTVYTHAVLPALLFGTCSERRTFRSVDNITLRQGVRGLVNLRMSFAHVKRGAGGTGDMESGMTMNATVRIMPGEQPKVVAQDMVQTAFQDEGPLPNRFLIDGEGDSTAGWEFLTGSFRAPVAPVTNGSRFFTGSAAPNSNTTSRLMNYAEVNEWLLKAVRDAALDPTARAKIPASLSVEALPRADGMQELSFTLRVAAPTPAAGSPSVFGGGASPGEASMVSVCDFHTLCAIPGELPTPAYTDFASLEEAAAPGGTASGDGEYECYTLKVPRLQTVVTRNENCECGSGVGQAQRSDPTRDQRRNGATIRNKFGSGAFVQ